MATSAPTTEERDANLDALQDAVKKWAGIERTRLGNESKFLRSVLDGRGATELLNKNLDIAADLTVNEINAFLSAD